MQTVLIKLGGSLLEKAEFLPELAAELKQAPWKAAFIHGGGPVISRLFDAFGKKSHFVNGLRATSDDTIDLVEMALSGHVNKWLARQLSAAGVPAVGISGTDALLLLAEPLDSGNPESNRVGRVIEVKSQILETLWRDGWLPIISPLGVTRTGKALNINADSAAYALALALHSETLIFLTDVPGIFWDETVLPRLTPDLLEKGVDSGRIHSGMLPKLEMGFSALNAGVHTLISTWQGRNTLTKLLSRSDIIFTELTRKEE